MPTAPLPPLSATPMQLLRDYPHALAVHLSTVAPPQDAPRVLAHYAEPNCPGYQPVAAPAWEWPYLSKDETVAVAAARPVWRIEPDATPIVIAGWYLTAALSTGETRILAEHFTGQSVTIPMTGRGVVYLIRLTLSQREVL